jgi:hypothetical protein
MLHALAPYLVVASLIAAAGGALYGAGTIGVAPVYALLLAASLVAGIGYARWDERHHT